MGSSDSTLLAIASKGPVEDHDDVIGRLQALAAELDPSDGLSWFNRLYLAFASAQRDAARRHHFADLRFVERLECQLADLYFVALAAHLSDPGAGPSAWEPLFQARSRAEITPPQLALAGLNAHLNRDLPVALVTTFIELDREPARETRSHTDYQHGAVIQESTLLGVAQWLPGQEHAALEGARTELERLLEIWSLKRARDAAWVAAEVRWALRANPVVARHHLDALDRMVGLAGRGLLLPAAPPEPRSARVTSSR